MIRFEPGQMSFCALKNEKKKISSAKQDGRVREQRVWGEMVGDVPWEQKIRALELGLFSLLLFFPPHFLEDPAVISNQSLDEGCFLWLINTLTWTHPNRDRIEKGKWRSWCPVSRSTDIGPSMSFFTPNPKFFLLSDIMRVISSMQQLNEKWMLSFLECPSV